MKFNHEDFGFADEKTFQLAMTCGPIVLFEIRKHASKVKHAENRVAGARKTLVVELETAMEENSMIRFIKGWVKQHEDNLAYCKARLAYLRKVKHAAY